MTLLAGIGATCLVVAAPVFLPQEIPGLAVGPPDPTSGVSPINALHADLDGNGEVDLVFRDGVVLQIDGTFQPAIAMPPAVAETHASLDVWGGWLYAWHGATVSPYRIENGAWVADEPRPVEAIEPVEETGAGSPELDAFLWALDEDDSPELFRATPAGIRYWTRTEYGYAASPILPIVPGPSWVPDSSVAIWPDSERQAIHNRFALNCTLVFDAGRIRIEVPVLDGPGRKRIRQYQYRVPDGSATRAPAAPRALLSPVVPEEARAGRLNSDPVLDVAVCEVDASPSGVRLLPVASLGASFDGGASFDWRRTGVLPGFHQATWCTDVNNDGLADLVVEGSGLGEVSPRDFIVQVLTRSGIDHHIEIYLQSPEGLAKRPAVERNIELAMGRLPILGGIRLARYLDGDLATVAGDFDGAGWNELAVHRSDARVELWRLDPDGGDARRPWHSIDVSAGAQMAVADVDADGADDLVLQPSGGSSPRQHATTVYFYRSAS